MSLPANLSALRDEAMGISCEAWAIRKRWVLARGIDRAGPCPVCGGEDRFAIHTKKNTFNCRGCGIAGHGVIDLVMQTERVEFVAACEIVTGRKAEAAPDPTVTAQLRAEAEAEQKKRADEETRYREAARKAAFETWRRAHRPRWPEGPADDFGSAVIGYLRLRGIDFSGAARAIGNALRLGEIERHPYKEKRGGIWVTVHEGPAMLAAVQRPDGHFGAVHVTWLDSKQDKGRLVLPPDDEGRARPTKKVLGVKKGGAIRLFTPSEHVHRIVMGEGIETTLTAAAHGFELETAYWAGVDLGNMAGRAARSVTGGQIWDRPDLDDRDSFTPPGWCEELICLCDSDEAETHTEEKVIRGLRRALALREEARARGDDLPPLAVSYVPPLGGGRDLNDLVRVR